jgi:nitrate/TMAO reductase-like tetraheme cytochrome c subunit
MQWVAQEYRQSGHAINRTGVSAGCHDCHNSAQLPGSSLVQGQGRNQGRRSGRARGVVSTEEKFKKERLRMAKSGLGGIQGERFGNCRHCHVFSKEIVAKQKDFVRPMHEQVLAKAATCVDCHKGIAHAAPDE